MSETLSNAQMAALRAMPLDLTLEGNLPSRGPSGSTVRALARAGLIVCDGRRWTLTGDGRHARRREGA